MTKFWIALLAGLCLIGSSGQGALAESAEPPLPTFLQPYYAPLLKVSGAWLSPGAHQTRDAIDEYTFTSSDQSVNIIIGNLPCAPSVCETAFNLVLQTSNLQATKSAGAFRIISPFEYRAEWKGGLASNFLYV